MPETTSRPEAAPLTAQWEVTPCDGGQHGITTCSRCGQDLEHHKQSPSCPKCGATFLPGIKVGPSFGGSDF